MPRNAPAPGRPGTLPTRVRRLEGRVDSLENRVENLEGRGPAEPETVAASGEPALESAPRCPGCNLPVEPPRGRQCVWCGFVFAAAPPRRRRK